MSHEPEDLPGKRTIVPSRAGELARMKKRVQSSRSHSGLGDFLFVCCIAGKTKVDRNIDGGHPPVSNGASYCENR